jgi:hypothetical protein
LHVPVWLTAADQNVPINDVPAFGRPVLKKTYAPVWELYVCTLLGGLHNAEAGVEAMPTITRATAAPSTIFLVMFSLPPLNQ